MKQFDFGIKLFLKDIQARNFKMKKLNSLVTSKYRPDTLDIAGMGSIRSAISTYQKHLDSFANSEALQRAAAMASTYQNAMGSFANSEALQRAAAMASTYQNAMGSFANSDALQRAAAMASTYQKAMGSFANSEALQRAAAMASTYQNAMGSFANSDALQRAISAFAESSNLQAALKSIDQFESQILASELHEENFTYDELERNFDELGKATDTESFVKVFSRLSPAIKAILLFCILQLLAVAQNVVGNIVAPHVEKLISNPKITEREKVKQLKAFSFDELNLANYGFVKTERLLLRGSPSSNSNIKDELRLGQVVTVLNKQRNWTEISYTYENGEIFHGWVFSRYIEKFKQ